VAIDFIKVIGGDRSLIMRRKVDYSWQQLPTETLMKKLHRHGLSRKYLKKSDLFSYFTEKEAYLKDFEETVYLSNTNSEQQPNAQICNMMSSICITVDFFMMITIKNCTNVL